MKKLLAMVLLFPGTLLAQNPFNGTWRTNPDESKPPTRPFVFSVKNGFYDCTTCVPQVHVRADGTDQPVAGLPHDTLAVTEVDSNRIQVVFKQDGKILSQQLRTADENGRVLHIKATVYHPEPGEPVIQETTSDRVGEPTPGANGTSGSWRTAKVNVSNNGLLQTLRETDTSLSLSTPPGETWTAEFDGKDYPIKGSYSASSVAARKIDDRTVALTFKQGVTVVRVSTLKVSSDGKTITTVSQNKLSGSTSTSVATKQE